jgi:CheY-like chemotaxis protein
MRVLLVDHDSEALETISRAIRGVLELDCVTSKGDALLLLRQNAYDVLIACERCVDGSGLDLLARTARTAVPLKRIFAAASERLQLLGPRLAPFKVQRTINYPIDLEELWLAIAQVTSGPTTRPTAPSNAWCSTSAASLPPVPCHVRRFRRARPRRCRSLRRASAHHGQRRRTRRHRAARTTRTRTAVAAATAAAPAAAGGSHRGAAQDHIRHRPHARPESARAAQDHVRHRRMRALNPPAPPVPPMTPAGPEEFPPWTPELPVQDDFAEVAAQARFGVQQKTVDEAAKRKRSRLIAAGAIAAAVAGVIVLLIEQFYDPEARAREQAISREIDRMAEQQKVSDGLALIEIEIENAIMANDLVTARRELAELNDRSPNHPRLDFLRDAIDRAEALAKLSPDSKPAAPTQAAMPAPGERSQTKARVERVVDRTPDRPVTRSADRNASPTPRLGQRQSTYTRLWRPHRRLSAAIAAAGCTDQFRAGQHHPAQ